MKKLIILFVAFLTLVFCNTTVSQAVTLGFDLDFQEVLVGELVDAELIISGLGDGGAPSLSTFDLEIGFDSAILAFESVTFGSYLGGTDPSSFETSLGFTDYGTGTVNIFEISWLYANQASDPFCPPGYPPYLDDIQPSSFTLATLTFDTLFLGTSPLNISINTLGDVNGYPLAYNLKSGNIKVVPEPATLILLGSGLAGIGFLRKKKTNQVG